MTQAQYRAWLMSQVHAGKLSDVEAGRMLDAWTPQTAPIPYAVPTSKVADQVLIHRALVRDGETVAGAWRLIAMGGDFTNLLKNERAAEQAQLAERAKQTWLASEEGIRASRIEDEKQAAARAERVKDGRWLISRAQGDRSVADDLTDDEVLSLAFGEDTRSKPSSLPSRIVRDQQITGADDNDANDLDANLRAAGLAEEGGA
jgi:hypothetical protein